MHSLQQSVANSVDDPSGNLAIDDHRIDDLPTIMRHDVVQYLHSAGFDIHFHDRDRGSVGIRHLVDDERFGRLHPRW